MSKRIDYQTNEHDCITPCPYEEKNPQGKPIMVGSWGCVFSCRYCQKNSCTEKYIECSHE